jgi:hypothetical protein
MYTWYVKDRVSDAVGHGSKSSRGMTKIIVDLASVQRFNETMYTN